MAASSDGGHDGGASLMFTLSFSLTLNMLDEMNEEQLNLVLKFDVAMES